MTDWQAQGWWQAADGRWYPPAGAGWWQGADGQWYPPGYGDPTQAYGTPSGPYGPVSGQQSGQYGTPPGPYGPVSGQHAVPTTEQYAATPAPAPAYAGDRRVEPTGDVPLSDDVAPADSAVGTVLIRWSTAVAQEAWSHEAASVIAGFEQRLGRAETDVAGLRTGDAELPAELHRVVGELEAGERTLRDLRDQQAHATQALAEAEKAARSTKLKLILVGLGVAAVLVLILLAL